jgi:hypothetical protein
VPIFFGGSVLAEDGRARFKEEIEHDVRNGLFLPRLSDRHRTCSRHEGEFLHAPLEGQFLPGVDCCDQTGRGLKALKLVL